MASMGISPDHSGVHYQQQIDALQSQLERNQALLKVLYNISLACHGITSFRDIFEATHRELSTIFSFDAFYITLCDTRNPTVFMAVLMVDEGVKEYQEQQAVGPLTGRVVATREPLLFYDLSEERKSLARAPEPFGPGQKRTRGWLGVPLLVGQNAVGVISLQSYQAGAYDLVDSDALQRVGNVVAVALENAQLDQAQRLFSTMMANQIAARTVELVTLSQIAGALVLQYPLPVLLERALGLIVPLFQLDGGNVRLLDAAREELLLVAQHNMPADYQQRTARMRLADSALGQVLSTNQPLSITSGLQGSEENIFPPPFESVLSMPLQIGGRMLGTLSLLGKQAHVFTQQQIDLAQAVCNQLAIAIENARLFEEQHRQIAELRALSTISHAAGTADSLPTLLRQVHDALQPFIQLDAFSMVVYDPDREIITDGISIDEGQEFAYWSNQPPPPNSLTAWVIRNQRTLHFDDIDRQIGEYPALAQHLVGVGKHAVSWLGVPLLSRDATVIGAISVQSYGAAAFGARDELFLKNVARQVALHVQNMRLLIQRERQIRELDAISRIGALISASFQLDEMLDVVYQTLQQITDASVFYLLICDPADITITHAMFVEQGQRIELPWYGHPPAEGSLSAWIMRQRAPLLFRDIRDQRDQAARLGISPIAIGPDNPVRSWAGVPVLAQDGQAIGVLSVQHYQSDRYDQQTVDFLGRVASHISLGTQKVRLFAEAQQHAVAAERQAQRMALVNRIALLLSSRLNQQEVLDVAAQELVRLFWADHTGIVLFDEGGQWGTVLAEFPSNGSLGMQLPLQGNPMIEELVETRRPVCITSIAADPRAALVRPYLQRLGILSMMIVPLVSRGQVIGSIGLDSLTQLREFTQDEQDLFLTIAASIASALENARLFAAEQEARHTADTLREMARVLSSSFDSREVLQLILRELREMIPYDTASIMLLDRQLLRFAAYDGFEPGLVLQERYFQLDQAGGAWHVVRNREPLIIADTHASSLWEPEPDHSQIRAWLGVPLIVKGQVIGVLNIDAHHPNAFSTRDAEAARAFADQAAVALENARLYEESVTQVEQELAIARTIQSNLFPRALPQLPGLALDARCLPARETGGDFFDFVTLREAADPRAGLLAIIIGDASGKSITGAMLMAIARSTVRSEARNYQTPERVLRESNRWIAEDVPRRSFVALSYATLDLGTRQLALANGGQLAPLRRRPDGQVAYLEVPGPTLPLGILPDTPYAAREVALEPGDLLLFYTDGIVEAQNEDHELFGFERLESLVHAYGALPPAELIGLVLREISAFMGGMPQHDDMTIVALRID